MKNGQWASSFYAFRQTLHMIVFGILAFHISAWNVSPVVLTLYAAVNLEEFMNMKLLNSVGDSIWKHTGEATITFPNLNNGFFKFYLDSLEIDFKAMLIMIINLFKIGSPFDKAQSDPVCINMAEDMSVSEILLHPANFGHETAMMALLTIILFL